MKNHQNNNRCRAASVGRSSLRDRDLMSSTPPSLPLATETNQTNRTNIIASSPFRRQRHGGGGGGSSSIPAATTTSSSSNQQNKRRTRSLTPTPSSARKGNNNLTPQEQQRSLKKSTITLQQRIRIRPQSRPKSKYQETQMARARIPFLIILKELGLVPQDYDVQKPLFTFETAGNNDNHDGISSDDVLFSKYNWLFQAMLLKDDYDATIPPASTLTTKQKSTNLKISCRYETPAEIKQKYASIIEKMEYNFVGDGNIGNQMKHLLESLLTQTKHEQVMQEEFRKRYPHMINAAEDGAQNNNNEDDQRQIISTSASVVQHEELAMNIMKTLMILSQNPVHRHRMRLKEYGKFVTRTKEFDEYHQDFNGCDNKIRSERNDSIDVVDDEEYTQWKKEFQKSQYSWTPAAEHLENEMAMRHEDESKEKCKSRSKESQQHKQNDDFSNHNPVVPKSPVILTKTNKTGDAVTSEPNWRTLFNQMNDPFRNFREVLKNEYDYTSEINTFNRYASSTLLPPPPQLLPMKSEFDTAIRDGKQPFLPHHGQSHFKERQICNDLCFALRGISSNNFQISTKTTNMSLSPNWIFQPSFENFSASTDQSFSSLLEEILDTCVNPIHDICSIIGTSSINSTLYFFDNKPSFNLARVTSQSSTTIRAIYHHVSTKIVHLFLLDVVSFQDYHFGAAANVTIKTAAATTFLMLRLYQNIVLKWKWKIQLVHTLLHNCCCFSSSPTTQTTASSLVKSREDKDDNNATAIHVGSCLSRLYRSLCDSILLLQEHEKQHIVRQPPKTATASVQVRQNNIKITRNSNNGMYVQTTLNLFLAALQPYMAILETFVTEGILLDPGKETFLTMVDETRTNFEQQQPTAQSVQLRNDFDSIPSFFRDNSSVTAGDILWCGIHVQIILNHQRCLFNHQSRSRYHCDNVLVPLTWRAPSPAVHTFVARELLNPFFNTNSEHKNENENNNNDHNVMSFVIFNQVTVPSSSIVTSQDEDKSEVLPTITKVRNNPHPDYQQSTNMDPTDSLRFNMKVQCLSASSTCVDILLGRNKDQITKKEYCQYQEYGVINVANPNEDIEDCGKNPQEEPNENEDNKNKAVYEAALLPTTMPPTILTNILNTNHKQQHDFFFYSSLHGHLNAFQSIYFMHDLDLLSPFLDGLFASLDSVVKATTTMASFSSTSIFYQEERKKNYCSKNPGRLKAVEALPPELIAPFFESEQRLTSLLRSAVGTRYPSNQGHDAFADGSLLLASSSLSWLTMIRRSRVLVTRPRSLQADNDEDENDNDYYNNNNDDGSNNNTKSREATITSISEKMILDMMNHNTNVDKTNNTIRDELKKSDEENDKKGAFLAEKRQHKANPSVFDPLRALESIRIELEPAWPISMILNKALINRYNQIFNLFLRLKYCEHLLQRARLRMNGGCLGRQISFNTVSQDNGNTDDRNDYFRQKAFNHPSGKRSRRRNSTSSTRQFIFVAKMSHIVKCLHNHCANVTKSITVITVGIHNDNPCSNNVTTHNEKRNSGNINTKCDNDSSHGEHLLIMDMEFTRKGGLKYLVEWHNHNIQKILRFCMLGYPQQQQQRSNVLQTYMSNILSSCITTPRMLLFCRSNSTSVDCVTSSFLDEEESRFRKNVTYMIATLERMQKASVSARTSATTYSSISKTQTISKGWLEGLLLMLDFDCSLKYFGSQ